MTWHALVVLIYALFIFLGGMMGFMKAHSSVSLWMGSASSLLLLLSAFGIYRSQGWGLILAFVVTTVLAFFFGFRFYTKQAFFPAGLTTLLSVGTLLLLSFLPRK